MIFLRPIFGVLRSGRRMRASAVGYCLWRRIDLKAVIAARFGVA